MVAHSGRQALGAAVALSASSCGRAPCRAALGLGPAGSRVLVDVARVVTVKWTFESHHAHDLALALEAATAAAAAPALPAASTATVRVRPALAGEGRYFVRVPEGEQSPVWLTWGALLASAYLPCCWLLRPATAITWVRPQTH